MNALRFLYKHVTSALDSFLDTLNSDLSSYHNKVNGAGESSLCAGGI